MRAGGRNGGILTPCQLHNLFVRARAMGLKGSGLHAALLLHRRGSLRPKDLAIETGTSHAAVTVVLDKFTLKNWVVREDDAGDARGKIVTLTPAGRKAFQKLFTP